MFKRLAMIVASAAVGATAIGSAQAKPSNCAPRCASLESTAPPSSIMPTPFERFGEQFAGKASLISVPVNGATRVDLGFAFKIGETAYTTAYIYENAVVSFGSLLPSGNTATAVGGGFVPYIAPYSLDLTQSGGVTGREPNGIYFQKGQVDPYADTGGAFSTDDLRSAVRIVWYGLTAQTRNAAGASIMVPVYTELVLTGDSMSTTDPVNNSFAFRYGVYDPNTNTDDPNQVDYGAFVGFDFGAQRLQVSPKNGRFASNATDSAFDMQNGVIINQLFPAVPEPTTWATMLLGFALVGWALRRRPDGVAVLAVR